MPVSGTTAAPLIVTPPSSSSRGVSVQDAARAYGAADSGAGFGDMLARAVDGAVQTGHAAESEAMQAIAGNGNLTAVVQAVSRAELALQTTTAVRDRVVQAYQDIMRMPI